MRTFKLVVGYDGTEFHGWQVQPGQRTVQGVLEAELREVLGEGVRVAAAGRTDSGCHARGQVVSFSTDATLPARALAPALRARLPRDLEIRSAEEVGRGFDARRSAVARRYSYRLLHAEDVVWRRFAWFPRLRLDGERLSLATRPLEGDHDCAAMQASGGPPVTTLCRVIRTSWRGWEGGLMLDLVANHFLYRMVRNVVGTALQLMEESDPAAAMEAVMASRDRRRAGPTAPPQGLCLEEVFYPAEPQQDGARR